MLRDHPPLTLRKAEALLWLSRGRFVRDIVAVVDHSLRTVNMHFELMLQRLSVENRTSTAAFAVRHLHVG